MCVYTSGKENQNQSNSQGDSSQVNGLQTEELTQLREEVEELRKQHTLLQTQLHDKDALINTLVSKCVCVWHRHPSPPPDTILWLPGERFPNSNGGHCTQNMIETADIITQTGV